jgi:SAM-dependent methyltransferase
MTDYIFKDNAVDEELKRLKLLEAAFDDATRAMLDRHLAPGRRCLEIGPGAGAVLEWIGSRVGSGGLACAVDRNTRYVDRLAALKPFDIRTGELKDFDGLGPFDLIHARYVFVHNAGAEGLLKKAAGWLKPGGVLALEEPDFTSASDVTGTEGDSHAKVNKAMWAMFRKGGLDPAFGLRLPALAEPLGFREIEARPDAHLCRGGSAVAAVMGESARVLAAKYAATGLADERDLARYAANAADPAHWAVYYTTVRLTARKA